MPESTTAPTAPAPASDSPSELKENGISGWLGKNKGGLFSGLLGLLIGLVSGNPLMRIMALVAGFSAGNVMFDGKDSTLNSMLGRKKDGASSATASSPAQSVTPAVQQQAQAPAAALASSQSPPPVFQDRFTQGVGVPNTKEDVLQNLKNTLSNDFVKPDYSNDGKPMFAIGAHPLKQAWFGDEAKEKADKVSALMINFYQSPSLRHLSPEGAANAILSNYEIQKQLHNNRQVEAELASYIMTNHAAIVNAVDNALPQEKMIPAPIRVNAYYPVVAAQTYVQEPAIVGHPIVCSAPPYYNNCGGNGRR